MPTPFSLAAGELGVSRPLQAAQEAAAAAGHLSAGLWTRRCARRAELRLKAFPQSPHGKGLSPVCTRRCSVRAELCAKALGQAWQR